jgi:hypothetical protein
MAGEPARAAGLISLVPRPDGGSPADDAGLADPYMLKGGGTVRTFFDMNRNNVFDAGMEVPDGPGSVLRTLRLSVGTGPTDPNSPVSLPWTFGLDDLPDDVRAIRLTFVGTKVDDIGLGFTRRSPSRAWSPSPGRLA